MVYRGRVFCKDRKNTIYILSFELIFFFYFFVQLDTIIGHYFCLNAQNFFTPNPLYGRSGTPYIKRWIVGKLKNSIFYTIKNEQLT